MVGTAPRAQLTAPTTRLVPSGQDADFACAYAIDVAPDDNRSAEQWARAAWEGASAPMRWFIVAGWRLVLRLRLGPPHSADHILGGRILEREHAETACPLPCPLLNAFQP